ncbi:MAG: Asp23/Gls24 family envelope stress response protein [Chloroflexi bacterium]|nr:Asp23/Gls24 family envelope stress response protein [Chloroflexota bacterium]
MSGPVLSVGRGVIVEMARLAALEVPGVLRIARAGPNWRTFFLGPAIVVRTHDDRVDIRMWVIARPGANLASVGGDVRGAIAGSVERLLGLHVGSVTVIVDGIGG